MLTEADGSWEFYNFQKTAGFPFQMQKMFNLMCCPHPYWDPEVALTGKVGELLPLDPASELPDST